MTIYVDQLEYYADRGSLTGWWCHMATDADTLDELHAMATKLGLRRYFQNKPGHPHYDLRPSKRELAIKLGAVEVKDIDLVRICFINKRKPNGTTTPTEGV